MEKAKKILKIMGKIANALVSVILALAVLLLVFTAFSPIKNIQILRVMSGSMEPKIKVGGVVVVNKVASESLKVGDVVTFTSSDDPNMTVTHRLVEIKEKDGQSVFLTRGDANQSNDIDEIGSSQIKGKVLFSVPFLGYLSVWMKQPLGFVLLIILPAVAIVVNEIINIKKSIEKEMEAKYQKMLAKKEKKPKNNKKKKTKKRETAVLLFFFSLSLFAIKPTFAYFSNTVVIPDNTFSMGCWVAPSVPVLLTEGQSISWEASAPNCPVAEVAYDYEVSVDENFSNTSASGNTSLTSVALSLANGTYYWHVQARNQYGNVSGYSQVGSFTVGAAVSQATVVINELMWMGSYDFNKTNFTNENDKWLELKNMTNEEINLDGWKLTRKDGNSENTMITFSKDSKILAKDYFLISRLDINESKINIKPDLISTDLILSDNNLQIKLYDDKGRLIDTADDGTGTPAVGFNGAGLHLSMERNTDPGDGALAGSWHTCENHAASSYWDEGIEDLGTPGRPNLSENDPSQSLVIQESLQDMGRIFQTANVSEPQVQFTLAEDKKSVTFSVSRFSPYEKLTYEIIYDAQPEEKGIFGEVDLTGEDNFSRENLLLGTCSALKQFCVYDQGMTEINLKVVLHKENGDSLEINKTIDY